MYDRNYICYNVTIVTNNVLKLSEICSIHLNDQVMKANMGNADRLIRAIIAGVIAILFFTKVISGTFGIVLLALGAVFLLTSFIRFCPLYLPFGISTCKKK